jgi:hypothetical protein
MHSHRIQCGNRYCIKCIYIIACEQEAISDVAIKTVDWWMRNPITLTKVYDFFCFNFIFSIYYFLRRNAAVDYK